MQVSVIIPMYNASDHIEKCLSSVLGQTFTPLEVLIVDDGSSDDSYAKAKQFESTLNLTIIKQQNKGPAIARNKAAEVAKGDWLAFLDADDYWLPEKLYEQQNLLHKYDDAGMIGTNIVQKKYVKENTIQRIGLKQNLLRNYFGTSTVMVRKSIFDNLGGFEPKLRHSEDYLLWLRICNIAPSYVIGKSLVYHDFKSEHSRLSEEVGKMYRGERYCYKEIYKKGYTNSIQYVGLYIFSWMKQIRYLIFKK